MTVAGAESRNRRAVEGYGLSVVAAVVVKLVCIILLDIIKPMECDREVSLQCMVTLSPAAAGLGSS